MGTAAGSLKSNSTDDGKTLYQSHAGRILKWVEILFGIIGIFEIYWVKYYIQRYGSHWWH